MSDSLFIVLYLRLKYICHCVVVTCRQAEPSLCVWGCMCVYGCVCVCVGGVGCVKRAPQIYLSRLTISVYISTAFR